MRGGIQATLMGLVGLACASTPQPTREEVQLAGTLRLIQIAQPARTLSEMSAVLGRGPHSCDDLSDTHQFCTWGGRETRATQVVAPVGSLLLSMPVEHGYSWYVGCELPKDGSPRSPDSCQAWYDAW